MARLPVPSRAVGAGLAAGAAAAGLGLAGAGVVRRRRRLSTPVPTAPVVATPRHHLGTGSFLDLDDGGRIRVLEAGEGRPVVLVHGVTLSAEIWHKQLSALSDRFRLIALDQRGHGQSQPGTDRPSLPRLARDLAQLLETLDLTDVVLVGHSLGGMVSLGLAAYHPDVMGSRVSSLLLVSTSGGPLTPLPPAVMRQALARSEGAARLALGLAERRRLHEPLLAPGRGTALVRRLVFGVDPDPADVELTRAVSAAVAPTLFSDLWATLPAVDLRPAYPALSLPTTVMVGSRDRVTPPRLARAMAAGVGGSRLVIVPGAGHMLMLERPAAVNAEIEALACSPT
jgi:pimeloyl-ACP methyl ester carboxylesterase